MTQDAMRMAILKTRKYAGKICIHEVSDEDAQIIWQAAHQSREAEVQRLREEVAQLKTERDSLAEGWSEAMEKWAKTESCLLDIQRKIRVVPVGLLGVRIDKNEFYANIDTVHKYAATLSFQALTPAKESE